MPKVWFRGSCFGVLVITLMYHPFLSRFLRFLLRSDLGSDFVCSNKVCSALPYSMMLRVRASTLFTSYPFLWFVCFGSITPTPSLIVEQSVHLDQPTLLGWVRLAAMYPQEAPSVSIAIWFRYMQLFALNAYLYSWSVGEIPEAGIFPPRSSATDYMLSQCPLTPPFWLMYMLICSFYYIVLSKSVGNAVPHWDLHHSKCFLIGPCDLTWASLISECS